MTRKILGITLNFWSFLALCLLVTGVSAVYVPTIIGAEPKSLIRSEVVKRDSRGRVEVMEVRAENGMCMAQITYDKVPRIHVLVASSGRLRNLGYLQINDGTEDGLSDETVMKNFNNAINTHCLPLIIPGYTLI